MDIRHLPESLYLQGEREAELEEIRREEARTEIAEAAHA